MKQFVPVVASTIALLFVVVTVSAWNGPTTSAPNGNVSAPLNVGSLDQVKNASLGVNGLAVFGNSLLQAGSYLNWGSTAGTNGYGIRDNAGTLEFKNSSGTWASLQSTVAALVGSSSNNDVSCTKYITVGTATIGITSSMNIGFTLIGGGGGGNSGSGGGGGGGGSTAILKNGSLIAAANGGAGIRGPLGTSGSQISGSVSVASGDTLAIYVGAGGGNGNPGGNDGGGGGSGYYGGGGGGNSGGGGGGTGTSGGTAGAGGGAVGGLGYGGNGRGGSSAGGYGGSGANGGSGSYNAGGGGGYGASGGSNGEVGASSGRGGNLGSGGYVGHEGGGGGTAVLTYTAPSCSL